MTELTMDETVAPVQKAVTDVLAERRLLIGALYEALEYFEDAADVADGSYGVPEANREMSLAQTVRDVLIRVGEKP